MSSTEKSITVEAPLDQVYEQWTRFEDFPSFMSNVEEVRMTGTRRMHWRVRVGGISKEWDAEVTQMVPNRVIAWRSLDGTENAGEVRFLQDGNDTEIRVRMEYDPGNFLLKAADVLTRHAGREVQEDLEHFKQQVEHKNAVPQ